MNDENKEISNKKKQYSNSNYNTNNKENININLNETNNGIQKNNNLKQINLFNKYENEYI